MKNCVLLLVCFMLFGFRINEPKDDKNTNENIEFLLEDTIGSTKEVFNDTLKYRGRTSKSPVFYHHTQKDFAKGSLSDAGANLYVSQSGKIQFINLFDLNADGFPEAIFNNDHNHYEAPDVLVYHNSNRYGLRSLVNPNARDAPAYQNFVWTMESLSSITRMPTEGGGKSVTSDLNGDGYKDLVFANFIHGSTLAEIPAYIYWGGPDGLNPLRRSLLPADRGTAVAVGDITGDGLQDIVVANSGREHLGIETPDFSHHSLAKLGGPRENTSYLFQQTEAGFTLNTREIVPTQFAVDVKIADIDNDGNTEVIFLELGEPGALRILGRKNGKWTQPLIIPVLAPKPLPTGKRIYQEILVKDLNGDGYADIFAPSAGGKSEIFWNQKGTFSILNKTMLDSENAMSGDAADLNKDGYVDLVIANFYAKSKTGKLHFDTNSFIWWGGKEGFDTQRTTPLPTLGAVSVRLTDVNNTGFTDILFAQHRDQETLDIPSYIYLNSANGFSPESRLDLQGYGAVNIAADDLDGDGRKEVILVNSMSGKARHSGIEDGPGNENVSATGLPMYIYRGNPNKKYSVANLIRVPESSAETNMAFADMEDNGKASLIHLRGGGHRLVIRYDIYNYPVSSELTEIDLPFRANTVNVADYNKDGILDIFVTPITGPQTILFLGLGQRKYKMKIFDFPHFAYTSSIGDVNNDGVLDAVTGSHKEICVLLGNTHDGMFQFGKPIVLTTDVLTTRVSMADFNNDGWLDILCQNLQNTYTKVYDIQSFVLINSKGSFSIQNKRPFATFGANGGTIAQVTNDGQPLAIISNYHADASRLVGTFIMSADKDGFPSEHGKLRLPSMSSGANLVLDFNGDGYQDILIFNHTGNDVYNGSLNPTGGVHGVGSFLYWGSKNGFATQDRSWIPSFGPHSRIMADPGSPGRRNPFEVYTSDFINNRTASDTFKIIVKGRFNQKQYVETEILIGKNAGNIKISELQAKPLSRSSTELEYEVYIPKGEIFRYRLKLNGFHSGNGPIVSSVAMYTIQN